VNAQQSASPGSNDRSFTIADAQPADVAALHRLIGALAAFERLSAICVATEADLASALFGGRRCAEALIARPEANPQVAAGFALFFQTYSTFLGRPTLWLEDLFVDVEYRGRGLGRQLLQTLAARAVDRQCRRFEWAVLDWNRPAIGFYEALGASVLPDWRIARVTGDPLRRLASDAVNKPLTPANPTAGQR
jgi:GNAT superfamily N-acetyltransferase